MFYSLEEAAAKLGKSEDDIRELVKAGRLREFRDGPNMLFKVNEVEALLSDTSVMALKAEKKEAPQEEPAKEEAAKEEAPQEEPATEEVTAEEAGTAMELEAAEEQPAEAQAAQPKPKPQAEAPAEPGEPELAEAEPQLQPEPEEEIQLAQDMGGSGELELSDADTAIVDEGISILGETDADKAGLGEGAGGGDETALSGLSGLDETSVAAADEASLEEIEDDVSLDTFGSGSGLLDLSLQADDTSLGGILDEIYTPEGEGEPAEASAVAAAEGSALEMAAEAEQIAADEGFGEPQAPAMRPAGGPYMEVPPDTASNVLGIMLFIPLLVVIYTGVVAVAGFNNVMPSLLSMSKGIIWYVALGLGVLSLLIAGGGAMAGGEKKAKAPKPPKPKKAKKEKPPKPKKEKKPKEKKEKKKKEKKK